MTTYFEIIRYISITQKSKKKTIQSMGVGNHLCEL
jgi:hypothetical protein